MVEELFEDDGGVGESEVLAVVVDCLLADAEGGEVGDWRSFFADQVVNGEV